MNSEQEKSQTSGAPDGVEFIGASHLQSQRQTLETIGRLFSVFDEGVVFGKPLTAGEHTVITAAEVNVGMGVGYGSGYGTDDEQNKGGGTGSGGGGGAAGRPIAAIIISPREVEVEPIVDVTKIALAFFTMLGAIFIARRAMQKAAKL